VVNVFSLYTFFYNTGIDVELNTLQKISAGRTVRENYVKLFAAHQNVLTAVSIEKNGSYSLSFDKVDKSKSSGHSGCAKLIGWFDEFSKSPQFPDGEVRTHLLDADQTGDDLDAVADGVKYSLDKLCLRGAPVDMSQCTDQGGGGTVERVNTPLVNLNVPTDFSLITDCTIHNINNEQKVATRKALLSDSMNKANNRKHCDRDVEQLMYAAYAWEK
jgi:hypothetical protein